ncbi:MAG TPA: NAD-dependent protein deacylase [Rhodocyclaceae bacterium]|nr:NAD-dependent protein deacylase [Rhodocyclaceae bacterium]
MNPPDPKTIHEIAAAMRDARRLLVITGAGISADSGLPTYRGIGGLYTDSSTEEEIPIEAALSGVMLAANPAVTWKYLRQIENSCRGARFNDAHAILAAWQDRFEVCVLTQNVDGFHRDAGSRNLIEIHGDIHDLHCTRCDYAATVADYRELTMPPRCPKCHSAVRPRVVLFGESLPGESIYRLYAELAQGFDIIFSIGTTSVFPYIAGPVVHAIQLGIPTVEINPGETRVSAIVAYKLATGAAAALRALNEALHDG